MSAFGSKRKARKIKIQDDEDDPSPTGALPSTAPEFDQRPALQPSFKTRPFKQSSLRKTTNISDDGDEHSSLPKEGEYDEDDGGAPVVVRPSLGVRAGSSKLRKRPSTTKVSFGQASTAATDDEDAMILGDDSNENSFSESHPTGASSQRIIRKKGITKNSRLPLRSMETDEDRPRYSKEYLSELQSATPNTPSKLETLQSGQEDFDMSFDPSELEGATLVETSTQPTAVLTESEIREKKERRARLAQQDRAEDFISLSDDERSTGESYLSVLSKRQPAVISLKKEKRLVTDDNLDEDDSFFVEDGGLSLGNKAEREARKKKRADMASMIANAEGADGDETSDDSEAERRAAYEAAQTRAGMDGLSEERDQQKKRLGRNGPVPIPKITPLPDLSVVVKAFQEKVARKEAERALLKLKLEELEREREEIEKREPEVQRLLNEAGERYRSLMGGDILPSNGDMNGSITAAKSLLDQARSADTPGRGLESLGTTPSRPLEQMDVDM